MSKQPLRLAVRILLATGLMGASLGATSMAHAQDLLLSDLGGGYSKAFAINNYAYTSSNRIVAGEANDIYGNTKPCYWDTAGVHALPVGSGGQGSAYGVNQSGVIVGYVTVAPTGPPFGTHKKAARWVKSGGVYTLQLLGTLGGNNSVAYGINDSGAIVGESDITGNVYRRGFRWISGSGMLDLGTLGGNNSTARDINNSGYISGSADLTTGRVACRFFPGQPTVSLGTIPGGQGYYGSTFVGYAINESNKIVGEAQKPTTSPGGVSGASGTIGFYNPPSMPIGWGTSPLTLGPVKQNEARGVNTAGRAVGFSYGNIYPTFAWYADGINPTKLPVNDPFEDSAEAYGINDSGQFTAGVGQTVVGMVKSTAAIWFL